jgi:hypothetical protein
MFVWDERITIDRRGITQRPARDDRDAAGIGWPQQNALLRTVFERRRLSQIDLISRPEATSDMPVDQVRGM